MNRTTRTAAALAGTAVALVTAYGTAQAADHVLAPGQHRATVAAPVGGQDQQDRQDRQDRQDAGVGENGRPGPG
ncbi:hypothetical protein SAMN05216532_6350 [Streptomyces sp. 2231.1]|uniref:hypothetical protein n=1 Tax=Streptomyces sp. 2231.1 TaxID=1855347 RepID=UPI000898ABA1|nr:hypothetical protein [Streptomyces sp. 2231.1]SED94544.1 hypothetical protein SAMN05216532_6350 [Streptomyces sp. 2231.1]